MELDPMPKIQANLDTLTKWKEEILNTVPILYKIAVALAPIELESGYVSLTTGVTGTIEFQVRDLNSFHHAQELVDAIEKTFNSVPTSTDQPEYKCRRLRFEEFSLNLYIAQDAPHCKVIKVGEKIVPEKIVPELRLICEGDPEFDLHERWKE